MPSICFISSFFNPADFQRTVHNCERFLNETVGASFPKESFYFCEVHSKDCRSINPKLAQKGNYIGLNSESILWHKERCLNLLIKKFDLYNRADYIVWLDTDILFEKPIILPENFNADSFQPFKTSLRQSDKEGKSFQRFTAWSTDQKGDIGLSWGIKSNILKRVGGFFDYGIVGGNDTFFCNRLIGKPYSIGCPEFDKELSDYFKDNYSLRGNVVSLDNTVTHLYHGSTKNRAYDDRVNILRKHNFNPLDDLIVEKSGLYRLINPTFEADVKRYFINREEDD